MDALGLYIQVPFCASKCSFCNFSSRVVRSDVYDSYCRALTEEIQRLPELYKSAAVATDFLQSSVNSVYMGGGTPSLLGAVRVARIVTGLQQHFTFAPTVEFTLEVTPGSADPDFLESVRTVGVNRLSIGAQSFIDVELRSVGRLHSADDTRKLIQAARDTGFTNISLDLIAGLPHQSESSWQSSLQSAIEQRPEHISVYLFEVDKKSRLGSEALRHGVRYHAHALPGEDFMADAYEQARHWLHKAGYFQYEISNFALPGQKSIHNCKYWQLKPYVGLGAGAHSSNGEARWENMAPVEAYESCLKRGESPICQHCLLSPDARLEEFFFLGLRQTEGINLAEARDRWGSERVAIWGEKIAFLEKEGWLDRCNGHIRLADRALLVSNEIFQEFISA